MSKVKSASIKKFTRIMTQPSCAMWLLQTYSLREGYHLASKFTWIHDHAEKEACVGILLPTECFETI